MPVKVPMPYFPYDKLDLLVQIKLRPVSESSFSPVSIPTTEPTTGQFTRTIASGDLPEITPSDVSVTYIAYVAMAGQNTSASAVTLNWRMLRNSQHVSSGSASVSANNFWRLIATWLGVVPGDVIEVRLWGSAAGLNYDFTAFQIHPTRLYPPQALNRPCYAYFAGFVAVPVFTTANAPAGSVTTTGTAVQHLDATIATISSEAGYDVLAPRATMGLFRAAYGDTTSPVNTGSTATGTARTGLTQLRSVLPTVIRLSVFRVW